MAILEKRQDKAIAINLLNRKVLTFNTEGSEERTLEDMRWTDYSRKAGSKACVLKKSRRYGMMKLHCTLARVTSNRQVDQWRGSSDYFYLVSECVCLNEYSNWRDYLEFSEYATAPVIKEGDKCSILEYNPKTGETLVHTVTAREITPDRITACYFEEESMEETMEAIKMTEQIRIKSIEETFEKFKEASRHYYLTSNGGDIVAKIYKELELLGADIETVIDVDLQIRDEVFGAKEER